jgi:hypothetical protein
MLNQATRFVQIVLPSIIKPLRTLWNEVIGFVFLVFAVMSATSAFRAWRDFDGSGDAVMRLALGGTFTIVMAYFGISSFLRARKISKS